LRITGPALEIICRYEPAAVRKQRWEAGNGPVPQGMRLGSTCEVPYCGKLHHMTLAEDGTRHWKHWTEYVARLAGLKHGHHFTVPPSATGVDPVAFAATLRNRLAMASRLRMTRFAVVTNRDGGVGVHKLWDGQKGGNRRDQRREGR
jgi:hypothetical protein